MSENFHWDSVNSSADPHQTKASMPNNIIEVKNAPGEHNTMATVLWKNTVDYIPKVSVIMPVYNVDAYLRECLNSLLNQTLREIEVICVDDGSTDDSLKILMEYAAMDPRISILQQQNLYAGVARNAGLMVARGEYLAILDSDDVFKPEMLQKAYQTIVQEKSDIIVFQHHIYTDTIVEETTSATNTPDIVTCSPNELGARLYTQCGYMPWNKLYRAEFLRQEDCVFQGIKATNDAYFSLTVLSFAKRITLSPEKLVYYRVKRKGALSSSRDTTAHTFWQAFQLAASTLQEKGIFQHFRLPYLNALLAVCYWTLRQLKKERENIRSLIQNTILPQHATPELLRCLSPYTQKIYELLISPPLIVILQVTPQQCPHLQETIRSICNQNVIPEEIVLWLSAHDFPNKELDLPRELFDQKNIRVTLRWYSDAQFTQLIQLTRHSYPNSSIILASADYTYSPSWLSRLWSEYNKDRKLSKSKYIYANTSTRFYWADKLKKIGLNTPCKNALTYNLPQCAHGILLPPDTLCDDGGTCTIGGIDISPDASIYLTALRSGDAIKIINNDLPQKHISETPDADALADIALNELDSMLRLDSRLKQRLAAEYLLNEESLQSPILSDMQRKLSIFRIDVRHTGSKEHDVDVYGEDINIYTPSYMCNEKGKGKFLQARSGRHRLLLIPNRTGTLMLQLRGYDFNIRGEKLPIYIDFNSVRIDGGAPISASVWCHSPHFIKLNVEEGQKIELDVLVIPHTHTLDELKQFMLALYRGVRYVEDRIDVLARELKHQIAIARAAYHSEQLEVALLHQQELSEQLNKQQDKIEMLKQLLLAKKQLNIHQRTEYLNLAEENVQLRMRMSKLEVHNEIARLKRKKRFSIGTKRKKITEQIRQLKAKQ